MAQLLQLKRSNCMWPIPTRFQRALHGVIVVICCTDKAKARIVGIIARVDHPVEIMNRDHQRSVESSQCRVEWRRHRRAAGGETGPKANCVKRDRAAASY